MREVRLYCRPLPPDAGRTVELRESEAFHAVRVLRLVPGTPVTLLDGAGTRATAVITDVTSDRRQPQVRCRIERVEHLPPPALDIRLCVAPPKGKPLMRIVRQCVELGASRISPVICRRSVDRPGSGYLARAEQEAVAAMKQSGNPFLPALDPPAEFAAVLAETRGTPAVMGATRPADAPEQAVRIPQGGRVVVWVGPEGGFTPDEIERLRHAGVTPVHIRGYVLRVDTAVAALLGWLLGPDRRGTHVE